jgi:hypothetical protein
MRERLCNKIFEEFWLSNNQRPTARLALSRKSGLPTLPRIYEASVEPWLGNDLKEGTAVFQIN